MATITMSFAVGATLAGDVPARGGQTEDRQTGSAVATRGPLGGHALGGLGRTEAGPKGHLVRGTEPGGAWLAMLERAGTRGTASQGHRQMGDLAAERWADAVVGVGAGDREQAAAWVSSVFGRTSFGASDDVAVSQRSAADMSGMQDGADGMVRAGLPPADESERVRQCESGGDWAAVSPDGMNIGGYQINVIHGWTREQLLDPVGNTLAMIALWRDGGWSAWACAYAAEESLATK